MVFQLMPSFACSDEGQPVVGIFAGLNDFKIVVLQHFGYRAAFFVAYRVFVDTSDGRYFRCGAGEKDFVGDVEGFARYQCFMNFIAEFAGNVHDGVPGEAGKDRLGRHRGVDDAVADDEDVFAAAFGDVAVVVEGEPFGVVVHERFHFDELGVQVVASGFCP